jgi:hypothetical protein
LSREQETECLHSWRKSVKSVLTTLKRVSTVGREVAKITAAWRQATSQEHCSAMDKGPRTVTLAHLVRFHWMGVVGGSQRLEQAELLHGNMHSRTLHSSRPRRPTSGPRVTSSPRPLVTRPAKLLLKVVWVRPKRGCLLTLAYYAFPRWYEFGQRRWNDVYWQGKTEVVNVTMISLIKGQILAKEPELIRRAYIY